MPTYEYECTHCGHKFEAFQKMSDKHLDACPKCNKKVRRLISSGSGIIFKGSGFYATDYRKKPKAPIHRSKDNTCPEAKKGCDGCKIH
ncbi:MAG: zinc ribbon domain-containing protein [Candidatus Omnitrophica bacterium]|nr:zinc ribbon domain-containing protein [Candidatus Omnitrophota bacterium]